MQRFSISLAVFALAAAALFLTRSRAEGDPLRLDEAEWIAISNAHWQQLSADRAPDEGLPPSPPDANPWRSGIHDSTFGAMYPGFAKLSLGALFAWRGHPQTTPEVFPRFQPDRELRRSARDSMRPALETGRFLMLVLAASIAVLLFWCAHAFAGPFAGLAAAALWSASPLVAHSADWLRTDLFPIALGLAALLLASSATHALRGERGAHFALLTGLACGALAGAATASKLSGALWCVALSVAIPLLWLAGPRPRPRLSHGPVSALLAFALSSLGVFVACSPALWDSPGNAIAYQGELLERWQGDLDNQARQQEQRAANGQPALEIAHTTLERAALTYERVFWRHEPIAAHTRQPIGLVLMPLALSLLLFHIAMRSEQSGRALTTLLTAGVLIAGTTLWVPGDWERFFLPLVALAALLEGAVVGVFCGGLRTVR